MIYSFSKSNHIPPFVEDMKLRGSISNGVLVFGFNLTRKFLNTVANPTFVCINPNLNPRKIPDISNTIN